MQIATNIRSQKDLADALAITQPSISNSRRRGVFPSRWVVKLAIKYGLNPEDLFSTSHQESLMPGNGVGLPSSARPLLANERRLYEELLEAKDNEIALLKKCHSKNSGKGNGKTNLDGLGNRKNGGDPVDIPTGA